MVPVPVAALQSGVASGVLSGRAHYLQWGVLQISLANFVIVVVMVALFVLALVVPFPGSGTEQRQGERSDVPD
jgi:phage shock protein PspC (stress-responsive transcriptional regulator)